MRRKEVVVVVVGSLGGGHRYFSCLTLTRTLPHHGQRPKLACCMEGSWASQSSIIGSAHWALSTLKG